MGSRTTVSQGKPREPVPVVAERVIHAKLAKAGIPLAAELPPGTGS